jgi:hypothetical protein
MDFIGTSGVQNMRTSAHWVASATVCLFGFLPTLAFGVEGDAYVDALVFEIQGMGMTLGSITHDRHLERLDQVRINVFFVVDCCHFLCS